MCFYRVFNLNATYKVFFLNSHIIQKNNHMGLLSDSLLPLFTVLSLLILGLIYVITYEWKYSNHSTSLSFIWIGLSRSLFPLFTFLLILFFAVRTLNPL